MPRTIATAFVRQVTRTAAVALAALAPFAPQARAESPGLEALEQYKLGHDEQRAVENRFFLKANRFEISPAGGYVPNNPFARRYMVGGILGFHFSELLSAQASFMYAPDLDEVDLKGLTEVLLVRAHDAGEEAADFQQPLDKAVLTGAIGVAWAPLYGKINLVGETVLNFDFYLYGGAGIISKQNYFARYDETEGEQNHVELVPQGNEVVVGPLLGFGQNYFVNQVMAVKLDLRAAFYVDNQPQYDIDVPPEGLRLYNNVIASVGVALFFPRMKRQMYEF